MNRRNFIQLLGVGAGATILSSTLIGCGGEPHAELFGWSGPAATLKDIRLKVLSYAILAPNPHNKQPWIVKLVGPSSFALYVDPHRLLPATDPYYRQIHIGQGTFLEIASIAASALGYKANIHYFPEGQYGNQALANKPVALLELVETSNVEPDPLFDHVLNRHSNKRSYDRTPLTPNEEQLLQAFHQKTSDAELVFKSSQQDQAQLTEFLTEAMAIETGNKARDEETIAMFRVNQAEIEKYRDGFGVAQTGMSGVKKIVAETFFLSREKLEKNPADFGKQAVDITHAAAESTATFAWLTTKSNQRIDQIKIGRDYCRINLQTTAMGLAQHPMSQILQEYDDMLPLQKSFKEGYGFVPNDTVQMLFRLGRAKPTVHSPRRPLDSIIGV